MLVFSRKDMIDYIYQRAHGYSNAIFLVHFPFQCLREGFAKFHRSTREFPQSLLILGFWASSG